MLSDDQHDAEMAVCANPKADKERIAQVALAEFAALRNEIQSRSSNEWTLININFTVIATVLGLIFTKEADHRLLLVLPLISPALGMLFVDHALNIRNLGSYIQKYIRPVVIDAAGSVKLLAYEDVIDTYEKNKFLRAMPLGLPLIVMFTLVPFAALFFVLPNLGPTWSWTIWSFGALLAVIQFLLWGAFICKPGIFDPFGAAPSQMMQAHHADDPLNRH